MQPNLRPGSPDLAAVLAALGSAARTLTPCPLPDAPGVLDDLGPLLRGWTSLAAATPEDLDPWARRHLDSLAAMETAWHPWADGVAAALAGHWELASRLPEPHGSAGLRAYQARTAAAARTWLTHRTRWP